MKKVLLITEYINPPYDEGIKKTVYNLYLDLNKRYELQVICRYGFNNDSIHIVETNPLFFSKKVKRIIKDFNPQTLIYLPFQSGTFASYIRLKVLSFFAIKVNSIFIALQPKPLKSWQQFAVKIIKPKRALTPSPTLKQFWDRIKVQNKIIPLYTDLTVFKPLNNTTLKQKLREKYNLPVNATIISHMGHLNEGRNLRSLIPLQKTGYQIVIVGSSSTPFDAYGEETLRKDLIESGIIILDKFIKNIEEIYKLSDIYVFPVVKKNSSIGMPLSILEARACGIPVLSTDYGSVNFFMGNDYGGIFYSIPDLFIEIVEEIRNLDQKVFIKTKVKDLNSLFFSLIQETIN